MEKVIRDGKVAVLYMPNYGGGWYSYHGYKELVFHPELVKLIEEGRSCEITTQLCRDLLGKDSANVISWKNSGLVIEWLPVGTPFWIHSDSYREYILTINDLILTA